MLVLAALECGDFCFMAGWWLQSSAMMRYMARFKMDQTAHASNATSQINF
jgi:hypothetical protein